VKKQTGPTKAANDARREAATRAHWPTFKRRLEQCTSLKDAQELLCQAVPESAPGYVYYRNLGALLHDNMVTKEATADEVALYRALAGRIAATQPALAATWRNLLGGGG